MNLIQSALKKATVSETESYAVTAMLCKCLIVLLLVIVASATEISRDWTLTKVHNINPDGHHPRTVLGVNGQWPLPPISVNSTDQLTIHYKNGMGDGTPTSLHAHGIFYNRTNYFDGASMITQCPIPDGHSMSYEILNSPSSPKETHGKQWGTYWAHSHYQGQYVDGLRTPLVIHHVDSDGNNMETHKYDDDYTITLSDWYHEWTGVINRTQYMIPESKGDEPTPDALLMYFHHTPWNGHAKNLEGFNENATLSFEPGKTYRLRVINMSALAMFYFWIEGHEMYIIEVDGVETKPFPVSHFDISAAQRVSVLVRARSDEHAKNWRIHAAVNPDSYEKKSSGLKFNITSTIKYGENLEMGHDGRKSLDKYDLFDDTQLEPVQEIPMYELTNHHVQSHRLEINSTFTKDNIVRMTFNNKTFVTPQVPSMMTIASEGKNALDPLLFGPNANAITAKHMDPVEFVLVNYDDDDHPFHLHGTSFQVVWRQSNFTSEDPRESPAFKAKQKNPIRRDTVTVPGNGRVAIRHISDNPGAWFFHCHMEWHLMAGLALVMIKSPEVFEKEVGHVPHGFLHQCKTQGFKTAGNAGGVRNSTKDFGDLPPNPLSHRKEV